MSLFDVIKYPVKDIYDNEGLSGLPMEIYHPWVTWLYSMCSDKDGTVPESIDNRAGQVQYFIMLGHIMYNKNMDSLELLAIMYLKELIRNYEG